jgi:hypothetical protein
VKSDTGIELELELQLLLEILIDTMRAYMKAFEVDDSNLSISDNMQRQYKAFKKITVYYIDEKNEVISWAVFEFDWENYKVRCSSDDSEILKKRHEIQLQTPAKILEGATIEIQSKVKKLKSERNFKMLKVVYTYTDEVWNDKKLLAKIRSEAGLVPFDKKTLKVSKKLKGYKESINSSLTENTMSIDFFV